MKRLFVVFALAFSLAGCAGTPFGEALRVATSTYNNPVGPVDIYRAKVVYAATLELVVAYREYCWKRQFAVLMNDPVAGPLCKDRRAVVRRMQAADDKANLALIKADNFARQNPSGTPIALIGAAVVAVNEFKNLVGGFASAALASK